MLETWNEGPTKSAIVDFVGRVTTEGGPDYVAPEARIATFDNDGTLWCEKPMYIQLDFIVRRLAETAASDAALAEQEPYKAAVAGDLRWFGGAITKHYQGDDSDMHLLMGGVIAAYAGVEVEAYSADAGAFVTKGQHPTLGRTFATCTYAPMVELLRYLEANDFTVYIASGGDRDFMRAFTHDLYGIPAERVVGSSNALQFVDDETGSSIVYLAQPDVFDDGPVKPIRIWSRTGRRPLLVAGNANGDIPALRFAGGPERPALRIVVRHDDAEREFDYTAGAESVLDMAGTHGWTVASVRYDWATVFA